ncbi:metallo-hydrolase/oxidoreductase [Mesorhizobium sp. M0909]|uniref:metallo-hydrolase/oxidoreductase n=1 Tax=Mesorhizobium sp. M0909 TaxID=2957024 RepID=UPI00333A037A
MASLKAIFDYHAVFLDRRLIARVSRAEQVGDGARARHSYEFDAFDGDLSAEDYKRAFSDPTYVDPFAIVRVVTTKNRFETLFDISPEVGDWLELDIAPTQKPSIGPMAFYAQLKPNGYTEQSRGTLRQARFLFSDREPDGGPRTPPRPLLSLGAAVTVTSSYAQQLAVDCQFPSSALANKAQLRTLLAAIPRPHAVVVHDVGQASFVSLVNNLGKPSLYYDAGWPIVFNGRTVPRQFALPSSKVPIVLSHWDFDHLAGFYQFPQLQKSRWVTPIQKFGANARRIAGILAANGTLFGWPGGALPFPWGQAEQCASPPSQMNDSGLALRVTLNNGKKVLLVGDAAYDNAGLPPGASFDFLVVTHHGANFVGAVPKSTSRRARGVVSVGKGNVYKHPKDHALWRHKVRGWAVIPTFGKIGSPRGDRWLGP